MQMTSLERRQPWIHRQLEIGVAEQRELDVLARREVRLSVGRLRGKAHDRRPERLERGLTVPKRAALGGAADGAWNLGPAWRRHVRSTGRVRIHLKDERAADPASVGGGTSRRSTVE